MELKFGMVLDLMTSKVTDNSEISSYYSKAKMKCFTICLYHGPILSNYTDNKRNLLKVIPGSRH